jgi:hypothetical protein
MQELSGFSSCLCRNYFGVDHVTAYRDALGFAAIAYHPYGLEEGTAERLEEFARVFGVKVTIDPANKGTSWYYPRNTMLVTAVLEEHYQDLKQRVR